MKIKVRIDGTAIAMLALLGFKLVEVVEVVFVVEASASFHAAKLIDGIELHAPLPLLLLTQNVGKEGEKKQ
jgi:hypothetical protein